MVRCVLTYKNIRVKSMKCTVSVKTRFSEDLSDSCALQTSLCQEGTRFFSHMNELSSVLETKVLYFSHSNHTG